MNLQLDLQTKFNKACCFVSLHRQLKRRLALLLAVQGYALKETCYTNQLKKEIKLVKWPKESRHSSTPTKWVLMWN